MGPEPYFCSRLVPHPYLSLLFQCVVVYGGLQNRYRTALLTGARKRTVKDSRPTGFTPRSTSPHPKRDRRRTPCARVPDDSSTPTSDWAGNSTAHPSER